jgi:ubiquinone biosynthesis protein UbiJ
MKFRILLWLLGRMLSKASKNSPELQKQLEGKELGFTLLTMDGKVARSFRVAGQRISSCSGTLDAPAFTMGFRDAAYAHQVMTAKNKQLAFMQGIQDKNITIKGDAALVMWFQGLFKYIMPKKKKPKN